MSTIIKLAKAAGAVSAVLAAWVAVMLLLPFVGPPGRQVAILGDPGAAVRTVAAAGGRVVEVRRGAVLARSDERAFAWRLYGAGAPLLVEGRIAAGCFAKAGA